VHALSQRIISSSYTTVNLVLQHIADKQTARALLRDIVGPSLECLKVNLATEVKEILEPHLLGHPITYNYYLTNNVQKAQAARHQR
jgi:hypothetical protein